MDILSQFSPEQIEALKIALGQAANSRSPIRERQLHDLRLMPTKDDPRPMFIMSTEAPRDGRDLTRTTPFPALLWHKATGEEITVHSAKEKAERGQEWVSTPPEHRVMTPIVELSELMAGLTEHERTVLFEEQNTSRMESLRERLADLTPEEVTKLFAELAPAKVAPGSTRRSA